MQQSRNWFGTLNNWTQPEYDQIFDLEKNGGTFVAIGKEFAPTTGTSHIHIYIHFHNDTTFAAMKKLNGKAQWKICKGTWVENCAYLSEDGDWECNGIPPMMPKEKGVRGGDLWRETRQLAMEGRLEEVDDRMYVTFYHTINRIANDCRRLTQCLDVLDNIWLFGPTGIGKSRHVFDNYPNAYRKMANKWWDGYRNEEVVVIEDIDKSHGMEMGFHLKLWADHYPFRAEVKGGSMMIRPKKIIITSNYRIEEIWVVEQNYQPLQRRFNFVDMTP
nr:MAG: replication associated protein [Cressdnaviricota sp.]